jgi:hypothetical protein
MERIIAPRVPSSDRREIEVSCRFSLDRHPLFITKLSVTWDLSRARVLCVTGGAVISPQGARLFPNRIRPSSFNRQQRDNVVGRRDVEGYEGFGLLDSRAKSLLDIQ